jgi:hypothetical protein
MSALRARSLCDTWCGARARSPAQPGQQDYKRGSGQFFPNRRKTFLSGRTAEFRIASGA